MLCLKKKWTEKLVEKCYKLSREYFIFQEIKKHIWPAFCSTFFEVPEDHVIHKSILQILRTRDRLQTDTTNQNSIVYMRGKFKLD